MTHKSLFYFMLFSVQCMCCTCIRIYTYSIYMHMYICDTCICVYVLYVQGNLINKVSFTSLLLICDLLFGGSWCDTWSSTVAQWDEAQLCSK